MAAPMTAHAHDDPVFARYRVKPGDEAFSLAAIDPQERTCLPDRKTAEEQFREDVAAIVEIQNAFYACGKKALLCVFQAMDAGGKDGTVRRVFGPVNPAGIQVNSFKKPSDEEFAHDYLWRIHKVVPPRGMIGIFNRSHYEDVLVVKVFGLAPAARIEARYEQINAFEKHLAENDVVILKFYLHISKDEQKGRFQERLDEPHKHWKFNQADLEVRRRWDDFSAAAELAITRCSTEHAPWFVIPANRNWYRNACVARIVRKTIEATEPEWPALEDDMSGIVIE
ncbi:MAG TPA: PPK2 family polyphosphate kinase [Alphaproteobacteria bacterium]|nr:PPK2 family polyphosphate kinase [Alphaproteobacteria bacterium]